MKTLKGLPLLAAVALGTGCIGDDVGGDGDSGDTGTMTMTTASTMTMTTAGDTTVGMTMGGTADSTGTGDDDDDDDDDMESSSGGDDPTIFMFDETPPEDYTQLDRKGFPAINTGLNLDLMMAGDKDAYNAATPADDANLDFAAQIVAALDTLHRGIPGMQTNNNTGLDDDLGAAGLTPCLPPQAPMDDCITQAGPFGIPDTLNLTIGSDTGFPNGRRPPEAAMDPILVVLLLDLDVHDLAAFYDIDGAGTPLNPMMNDVMLPTEWPYLAPPHEP